MANTFEVTVELPANLRERLEEIAHTLNRPPSWVVARAIENLIETEDIKLALAEADAGEFASQTEVEAVFAKWRARRRNGH